MRYLLVVAVALAVAGCSDKKRKEQELNTCIEQYPGAISSCLITRFEWDSVEAAKAAVYDRKLRSGR